MSSEVTRLDGILAATIDDRTRERIWKSASAILKHGPNPGQASDPTVLALGYVQSGKTTSITALAAAAADEGYQVIVALLGSTNLLLDQNKQRLEGSLGITTRSDYVWISETNPASDAAGKKLRSFVDMGRVCLVPVLKHAGRIRAVSKQLAKLPDDLRVLVIDDEADQASLNTSKDAESQTYAAIRELRSSVPSHLYVQYTATPYAPLMLDAADILSPQHVEFLTPGDGYTGGKQFFIDHADRVVRNVPLLDEQASKKPPLQLQKSLHQALSSFLAGTALLLLKDAASPPISMLVHSTARNDVQARYEFLIRRQLEQWRKTLMPDVPTTIPASITEERERLVLNGASDVDDQTFAHTLKFVLAQAMTWLVNSAADINKVKELVSAAVGAREDRGDKVTVVMRAFEKVEAEGVPFYETSWFGMAVRNGVALLAVLLVLFLAVRPAIKALRSGPKSPEALPAPGAEGGSGYAAYEQAPPIDRQALDGQIELAQRIARENPDDAVLALRRLLAEDARSGASA